MPYKNTPYPIPSAFAGNAINMDITVLKSNSLPYDLTGVTNISYALAVSAGSSALVTKTIADGGIVVTDAVNGKFEVSLVESDTSKLVTGNFPVMYYQEALLVDITGDPVTCYAGNLVLYPATLKA